MSLCFDKQPQGRSVEFLHPLITISAWQAEYKISKGGEYLISIQQSLIGLYGKKLVRQQTFSENSRHSDNLDMTSASFPLEKDSDCLPPFLPSSLLPHCEHPNSYLLMPNLKTLALVLKSATLGKRKMLSAET